MGLDGYKPVGELTQSATQRVLCWFRKTTHAEAESSHTDSAILPFPVTTQAVTPEESSDPRVARIISEIPQRRRREHRQAA